MKPILDSKYYLLSKIGSGATSVVYLTEDITNKKKYATKIMKRDIDIDEEEDEVEEENKKEEKNDILKRESEILSLIHHENIVNLIDYGEGSIKKKKSSSKNYPYLTLEYAEKGELFNYIYFPKKGFNEDFSKIIFKGIIKGIKACHENNIVHGDLKLENILLDDKFNPKIADFGYATYIKDNIKLKNIVGTLEYQAPEILLKKPYDGKKKDIFSLGVLLFLLVTGIKPFEVPFGKDKLYKYILKKQYSEYWKQIKNNDVEVDELSNEFKLLFIKMIQFNPNDRISLDEIINNKWFDDKIINNEDLISEFKLRENIIKDKLETQKKSSSDDSQINNNNTKGKHRKKNSSIYKVLNLTINKIFEDNTQIHFLDTQFGFSNLFLITKLRNKPVDFFNCLAHLIIERIINVDRINPNKKILKFEIYYNNIQNNEESEKNNNSFHIEKKLSIVGVKFYEMPNNTYSIVFKKIAGNKFEYYEKVSQIKEIILDLLSSQIIINYV